MLTGNPWIGSRPRARQKRRTEVGVALGRGQDPTLRKFLGEPSVLACDEDVRPTER
jgi:hypothetical protein